MYSAALLDHFQNPRNPGALPDANARARVENPACGDIFELSLKIENDVVVAARFRAKGCVPSMACASLLTELITGRTIAEARSLRREELIERIGGLPEASGHAAHLALDTLKAALAQLP